MHVCAGRKVVCFGGPTLDKVREHVGHLPMYPFARREKCSPFFPMVNSLPIPAFGPPIRPSRGPLCQLAQATSFNAHHTPRSGPQQTNHVRTVYRKLFKESSYLRLVGHRPTTDKEVLFFYSAGKVACQAFPKNIIKLWGIKAKLENKSWPRSKIFSRFLPVPEKLSRPPSSGEINFSA